MKPLIFCALLISLISSARSEEPTFGSILERVTKRDPITHAILHIDNRRQFKLEIDGEQAKVTIWKPMKVQDPDQEEYTFPSSDVVRQEQERLKFQEELNSLVDRCTRSEQRFRVSQYKKYPVRIGMPYEEAAELLKDEFKPDGLARAEKGAYRLESSTHSVVFRRDQLLDIITKENSNNLDSAGEE